VAAVGGGSGGQRRVVAGVAAAGVGAWPWQAWQWQARQRPAWSFALLLG